MQTIGKVSNLTGKFFAKDLDGNIVELKQGDEIVEGMIVYGDSTNNKSDSINITLNNNEVISMLSSQEQIFDNSMVSNIEDVSDDILNATSFDAFLDLLFENEGDEDILEEETTEGNEEVEPQSEDSASFAARDGSITDVLSDLRDARFKQTSTTLDVKSKFKTETDGLAHSSYESKNAFYTSPETKTTTNEKGLIPEPVDPIVPRTPSIQITAVLKLFAIDNNGNESLANTVNEGDIAWYIVRAFDGDKEISLTGDVTIIFTSGTATGGVDFDHTTQIVTVGQKFGTETFDDYISDNNEKFTLAIQTNSYSGSKGVVSTIEYDTTPVGTTILDNSNPVDENTPHNPNTTDNHNQESDKEIVFIKLFAADENGIVIKDGSGNYMQANEVYEGEDAKYIAYAFENDETTFNDETRLDIQNGTVDISFSNGTATSVTDFDSTSQTITIGVAFDTATMIDTLVEGEENYTVTIDNDSYSGNYESVETDTSAVTTTLKDVKLYVKIEAVDNEANESENLTYKLSIVNKNGDLVEVPVGKSIDVNLIYNQNGIDDATSGVDYIPNILVTISAGESSKQFTIPTLDDYYAEGNENLTITIDSIDNSSGAFDEIYPHTQANGALSDEIEANGIIKDNPSDIDQPTDENNIDDPTNGSYDQDDTIYAIIEGPANVNEGDITTDYTVKLVDKNGTPVVVTEDMTVTVTYNHNNTTPTQNGDTEYNDGDTISVVISANNSSNTFTVTTIDDPYKDDGEKYKLTITDIENTGEFENVVIGDKDGNYKNVTTTIHDNTTPLTETDVDTVKIVLVAVSSLTTVIADITNPDGTLNIDDTNITPEGGKLYYMAVAVDEDGKPLSTQGGNIDVSYTNNTTVNSDYTTNTTTVAIGTVFSVDANDDYFAEGDEDFDVIISNPQSTPYEAVEVDTNNNTVTSTIQDNPAQDTQNPDTPIEDGGYEADDTVYVKITHNDSVIEGNDLTHTVTLVDKDGVNITVPVGETITVTITYAPDATIDADFSTPKTITVTITGGNSSATITNTTIDDFVAEGNEQYTATITDVSQSNGTFENVAIHATENSVTGEIIDGVSLGIPDPATVDEDNFSVENSITTITDTQSLNIVAPNGDNTYTLLFDGTPTFTSDDGTFNTADGDILTSDGVVIEYVVSGNTTTAYAGSGRTNADRVFEITLNKNGVGGADDSYTYTQYKNIDHPVVDVDDDIVITFGYKITDQGQTSSVQNFTVTVSDSLPTAGNQNITLNEDSGAKTIYISDESFDGGSINLNNGVDAASDVANGGSIDIYDSSSTHIVGTLTNNGDGTLSFTPNQHFSGSTAGFSYIVSDGDGDSATGTVGITVNPVADKPDMNGATPGTESPTIKTTPQVKEDNDNNAGIEGGASYTVEIGLILPQITDSNDYTGDATNDDQPERLGLITLSSSTGDTIIANGIEYDLGVDSIKIYITDDPTNYHYNGIDTTGAIQLTQAQFEAIVVKFENDNAINPKFTVSVDEYEVNDDDTLKGGVTKASNSQDYEVDILAVTDPVTLAWNATGGLGTHDGSTFTFTTVNEGYGTINLKSLLTNTNGLETDSDGDLDGSEHRSYTITGIPEGTIITLDGRTVAADSTGTATINFPDNTKEDPDFTMTLNEYFSGTINGTITLNVTDTDNDSTGTINTETASVNFTMTVNPVANEVTLKVAQAQGLEDAGRTNSNDENVSADTIDAPENGIELYINVISDDNKDISGTGSIDYKEEYNVTIDGIPDGGSLYVWDNSASIWKLIDETNAGTNGDLVIINNADSTWKVTINDYQNDKLPKFIPPYNSDDNYTFDISAVSFDNPDTSIAQTLQIDVTVDAVADIPINDDLATATATDDDTDSNSFNLVSTEDNGAINLKDIFATPSTLDSNDNDSSETLTFKVTGLADGFGINGAIFIGGTGASRMWLVDIDELNADNVTLTAPTHFAGQVDFQVQFVTTEDAGDSKTHDPKDISVMITPVAEGAINTSDTQNEDESKVLNFGFSSSDNGGLSVGEENLVSFSIDVTGLEAAGVRLVSNGVDLTTGKTGYQSVTVTSGVLAEVTATLTEDIDTDYSFNISYTINDVAIDSNGNTYTDIKTVTDELYSITVNAVTDDITLAMSTITGLNNSVDGSGKVTVTGNGTFTKTLTVTGVDSDGRGSPDTDGSEEFTRITVSGVPEGITVGGVHGTYAGDTGGGNYSGFWYVDIPNQALNDVNGSTYDLVFDVDGSFDSNDLGDYNITITAYNQEQNNDVEQSDSQNFTLTIDTEITGPGPGTPATITAFYQDIDNDSMHDHSYTVSTVANTTLTDADAYQGSVVREDTQFQLSDVVYVETDISGATSQAFSITLKNVPNGVIVEGMTLNPNGFYTLSGSGNQAAIVAKLQSILITPVANQNTDANDISNTDLNFDIELTTYANGGASNFALINFSASVLPVTDEMNLTVVNDGSTNEDIAQTFSITLDNIADGAKTQIIDGKVYLQLTETYSDTQGSDGVSGSFVVAGKTMSVQNIDIGYGVQNYYVVESVVYNETLNFTFTPASNRDGTITIDTYIKNQESESWSSYNTDTITSHKTISFNVISVVDGFALDAGATINGNEDTLVLVDINLINTDSSEKLSAVSIGGLPNGFLLYYGSSSDGSDKSLANNLGNDGTVTMQMTYGVNESVNTNQWNIPLNNGVMPSYMWIKAPENWSGTIPALSIIAVDENGNISPETITAGTITPDVDTLTLNATQTFGKEGEDILLNLNANVVDLDGSETVTLTLSGFNSDKANFKANGEAISSNYDSGSDTYIIEGINVNDINALTVTHGAMNTTTITATAKMVESDGTESALVSTNNTFDIRITQSVASSGDDTLLLKDGIDIDGLAGIDTLVLNGVSFDPTKISNIEILDLKAGDNNISLALADIIDMTDSGKNLVIKGDILDSVSFTDNNWTKGASDGTYTTYTNSNDAAVTLKVEDTIQQPIN